MTRQFIIIVAFALATTGCAPVISEQSRRLVNTDAPFQTIRKHPENYVGKHVMLGGRIVTVRNTTDGAQLELVQFETTASGAFTGTYLSHGRFLAVTNMYVEPFVFRRGMLITLVGEVKGAKVLRLDDMDYAYPVIAMKEWYLWQDSGGEVSYVYPSQAPRYDPYNYGYGYEPFLPRQPYQGAIQPLLR